MSGKKSPGKLSLPKEIAPQENCPTGKLPLGKMLPKNRFTSLSLLLTLSYNCSFLNSFRGVSCFGFPKFPRKSICNGFPRQKLSKISQFSRASSTVSTETNVTDKIILNIFGVAMQTKLKSLMVFCTQEKKLMSSHFEVQLSSDRAVPRYYQKFPQNYPRRTSFFKIAFNRGQSF